MKDKPELYECVYPTYLNWNCRIWTIQQGSEISKDGELYRVVSVVRSPIPGTKPSLKVEKIDGPPEDLPEPTSSFDST